MLHTEVPFLLIQVHIPFCRLMHRSVKYLLISPETSIAKMTFLGMLRQGTCRWTAEVEGGLRPTQTNGPTQ